MLPITSFERLDDAPLEGAVGDSAVAPCRVVIADDAAGMRALLQTLLSLEPDFDVVGVARDGAEAVEIVERELPDLVVIDVTMPVMSGLEAIQRIRAIAPRTKIAVLSGERRSLPPGADAIIEKGTLNEALIAALRELCPSSPSAPVEEPGSAG